MPSQIPTIVVGVVRPGHLLGEHDLLSVDQVTAAGLHRTRTICRG
jgi:hypothetical protein